MRSTSKKNKQTRESEFSDEEGEEAKASWRSPPDRKKKVKIVEEKENYSFGDEAGEEAKVVSSRLGGARPHARKNELDYLREDERTKRKQSKSKTKEETEPVYNISPRRQIFEAKFEKYLANKSHKTKQEKKMEDLKKEDFDLYTKDRASPSK